MDFAVGDSLAWIYWIVLIIVSIRTAQGIFGIIHANHWLKNKYSSLSQANIACRHTFYVIIPVLREQKILAATANYFLDLDFPANQLKLILVSTEKEIAERKSPAEETTMDVIANLQKQKHGSRIIHLHYPNSRGKMVDQLNLAFDYVVKNSKTDPKKKFAVIYNADSRPHRQTFPLISKLMEIQYGRVYQQSSMYFNNFDEIERENSFWVEKYIKTNALLQTRWTLAHEIPRFFRQSYCLSKFHSRLFLAHCVGHGLFLRSDLLREIGEMPTGTVTEDLFLGYVLSLLGEPIFPVPLLEGAEVPVSFRNTLQQKYVWFFGPLDHFKYAGYFKKAFPKKASSFLRLWLAFQGLLPAAAWICSAWFFIFIILYPLVRGDQSLFWLGIGLFFINAPLSYLFVLKKHKFFDMLSSQQNTVPVSDYFWVFFFSPIVVFLHSVPPWLTLYRSIVSAVSGSAPQKPKTER